MIISKTDKDIILKTFKKINKQYEYNLFINKLKDVSYEENINKYKLKILTLDKNKIGARININKNINLYACIHVHYDFLNLLLYNDNKAVIQLYEDWIIKKDLKNNIIGNNLKNYSNNMHIINKSSFLCNCIKYKNIN